MRNPRSKRTKNSRRKGLVTSVIKTYARLPDENLVYVLLVLMARTARARTRAKATVRMRLNIMETTRMTTRIRMKTKTFKGWL
jgi:hypothetical protein